MYIKLLDENVEEIKKCEMKPFYNFISLSNLCNANCMFCDVHEKKEILCSLDVYDLLNQLKDMGANYVHFTGGGEPFANKNILSYFEYATKLNLKIIFITNGYALNEKIIEELEKYNIKAIFFSIDSHRAEIHNRIRGVDGIFDKARNSIKLIKKKYPRIKIVINHVLTKENIDSLKEFIKLKEKVDFDYLNPIIVKECPEYYFSNEQILNYKDSISEIKKLVNEYNISFLYDDIDFFKKNEFLNDGSDLSKNEVKCFFPSYCSFVDCVTGNVYPCDCSVHRDENFYSLGNLKKHPFKEIWCSSRACQLREMVKNYSCSCKVKCDCANVLFNKRIKD